MRRRGYRRLPATKGQHRSNGAHQSFTASESRWSRFRLGRFHPPGPVRCQRGSDVVAGNQNRCDPGSEGDACPQPSSGGRADADLQPACRTPCWHMLDANETNMSILPPEKTFKLHQDAEQRLLIRSAPPPVPHPPVSPPVPTQR